MIKASQRTLLTIAVHLVFNLIAFAQVDLTKYEVGVNAGSFIYQGDLTPSTVGSFRTPTVAFGINVNRPLTPLLKVRLDISAGQLKGDDAAYSKPEWRQQRNFNFTTSMTELAASLVFTPMGTTHRLYPYLIAGLGLSFINVKRDYSNFNTEYFADETLTAGLASDIEHRLPRVLPVAPVGVGVTYRLNQRLSLHPEASYRLMSTDYLDGFSQAANPGLKDHYYKFAIGLHYSLGQKDKYGCPVIRF